MRLVFLPVLLILLLNGCGHKGPLYLPAPEPKPVADMPQPAAGEVKP